MMQSPLREFRHSALACAIAAAFGVAHAQDKPAEEASPIETQATVEAGVGLVSGNPSDRAFWGQYNGMRNQDAYGLLGFGYSRRDGATGTWLEVLGSNLGLQTRELGVLWTRQGDWRLGANYGELRAINPYTVNTGVSGVGTTTPVATYLTGGAGSGHDLQLSTKRKGFGLAGSKWFAGQYQFEANVSSENKSGAQLFGIGSVCPSTASAGCSFTPGVTAGSGVLFYPQPIDYNHTQVEARLTYAGSDLQLSGGYYGSFFSNDNGAMFPGVPPILNNAVGQPLPAGPGVQAYLSHPVALPPDSKFNQVDMSGSYVLNPKLRTNFKFEYGQTTQDYDFTGAGLTGAPAGVANLDGEMVTQLAQIRVIATPIAKLSLVGEYRYHNREDKTPVVAYSQVGPTQYSNQRVSREVENAKLEASYRFPYAIQATAGLGYESIDRGSYTTSASYSGISALREETDESSWWLEARRNMTETLSGLIRFTSSSRDGSSWLAPGTSGIGLVPVSDPLALGSNAIYMPTIADRDRDKLRLMLTWLASDALTLQFSVDAGRDDYDAPTGFTLRKTRFNLYSLDVNYALSDAWNLNGYLSSGKQKLNQARPAGYILAFEDKALNAGVGFNGKLGEQWQLGGMLSYVDHTDRYEQTLGADAGPGTVQLLAVTGGLPDVVYRRTELRLFGNYLWGTRSTIRFDAAYQRLTYDDWGWSYGGVPFLYSDNSTLLLQRNQNVGYLGLSFIYSLK